MLAGGAAIIGRLDGAGHARWCMHEADSASCHLGLPRRLPGMGSQCTQTYVIGVFPRAPEGNLMAFCEPAWEVLGQHSHCILLVEMAPGLHQPILKVRGLRSHFSIGGDFPRGSEGKESTCSEEDPGSIPGLGRSPGEGKEYPLQYSGLENSMDCIAHGVPKSQTQLSNFHFTLDPICLSLSSFLLAPETGP